MAGEAELAHQNPVELLRRQYFQCIDPMLLSLPGAQSLKHPSNQHLIYQKLFNSSNIRFPPLLRYQFLVLKKIMTALEEAVDDPEEDVCDWFRVLRASRSSDETT